jgi:uncharacterized protein YqgC (DUF456 family)
MDETILIIITLALMALSLFLSAIPLVPGPVLVWSVAVAFAFLNDFERTPYLAVTVMTLIMLSGSTTRFWLPVIGFQSAEGGGSCLGTIGSILGAMIGSFVIPIPILGAIIGAIVASIGIALLQAKERQNLFKIGRDTLKTYIAGLVLEFCASILIILVFITSVVMTG